MWVSIEETINANGRKVDHIIRGLKNDRMLSEK
jgi:hypothetical protein